MKKNFLLIVLLVLVVAFASCEKDIDEPDNTAVVTQEESEEAEEVAEGNVVHLTDENFHEIIDNSEGIVIVDFWADWCGPCVKLGPILEEISAEEEITLYKVDVDECYETAVEFSISSIPMVYIYKDGEIVDSQLGAADKQTYLDMINQYR